MSGIGAKIAGQVLGPRPGLAIVSFWQGRVEIILRLLAPLVGSLPALIAAAVALGTILDNEVLREKTGVDALDDALDDAPDDLDELRDNTYASTGYVIAVAALAIIIEIAMIALRFINIGLINLKIKIFLIIDVILSAVLAAGHLAGGVLLAFYAAEWDDYSGDDDVDTIQQSMIAGAVFCFIALLLFALLALYMLIFMIKGWNNKVVKATIKKAVTS